VRRKRIAGRGMLRERSKPGNQFGRGDEVQCRRGQRWHMHRLADVTGSVGTTRMLVEETAASREIQKYDARKQRNCAVRCGAPEYTSTPSHEFHYSLTLLLFRPAGLLQVPNIRPDLLLDPATISRNPLLDPATIPA
jgi:hypothetical protein